jgi:hypothetical protein
MCRRAPPPRSPASARCGSGLVYSVLGAFVPGDVGASYDWIGFDPRGVGSSVPALSCDPG